MPAGRNIQVYGVDAVLQCYENNSIPAWAVICDKNVNAKYTGDSCKEGYEMLSQYLDMLKKYDSAATYSLRLFEDIDKPIRSNTPYDIAFNFSLRDKDEPATSNLPAVQGMNTSTLTTLLREISDLKTQNAVLTMEKEQDEDYIEELEKQLKAQPPVVPEKTMGAALLEKFMPTLVKWGETIGERVFKAAPDTALAGVPISDQDEQILIDNSVQRLKANCKRYSAGQVLSKIADICEHEPDKFDFYLTMIMK